MRAVLYARCSSTEQAIEGVTLEAQEAKMRAYAGLYGVDVMSITLDAGQSANLCSHIEPPKVPSKSNISALSQDQAVAFLGEGQRRI